MINHYISVAPAPKTVLGQINQHEITREDLLFFLAIGVPVMTGVALFMKVQEGLKALKEKNSFELQALRSEINGSISLLTERINTCLIGLDGRNGTVEQLRHEIQRTTGNLESMQRQLESYGVAINIRHNSKP